VKVKKLIQKIIDLIESRKPDNDSGMKKVWQLIANIFKNERDDDTDGMEQDLGDFGGFGE
jgi:hypothetical protein